MVESASSLLNLLTCCGIRFVVSEFAWLSLNPSCRRQTRLAVVKLEVGVGNCGIVAISLPWPGVRYTSGQWDG